MRLPFFSRFLPTSSATAAPIALVPSPAAVAPPAVEPPAEMAAQLAAVTAERDQLEAAFDAFKAAVTARETTDLAEYATLSAQHAEVTAQLATRTSELEALRAEHAKTREEITAEIRSKELATLAAAQGIALSEVPPESASATGTSDKAARIVEIEEALRAEKSPLKRGQLAQELKSLR